MDLTAIKARGWEITRVGNIFPACYSQKHAECSSESMEIDAPSDKVVRGYYANSEEIDKQGS